MNHFNFNRINKMGMKKKLLTGAGYIAAPKLTFAARHPRKAAMAAAATWVTDRVMRRNRRSSMRGTAAKGIGAAAIALPVGMWLGRKAFNQRQPQAM